MDSAKAGLFVAPGCWLRRRRYSGMNSEDLFRDSLFLLVKCLLCGWRVQAGMKRIGFVWYAKSAVHKRVQMCRMDDGRRDGRGRKEINGKGRK